jgi:DNA-binding NtrC family response regulator
LNTVEIRLPPLRERREDIPLLAHHFLDNYARRYRKFLTTFSEEALKSLLDYEWPGNVRELDHAVERAMLMAKGEVVEVADLNLLPGPGAERGLEEMSLDEVECFLIRKTLARCDGNVGQAAEALGLSRSALYRRLQRYGL